MRITLITPEGSQIGEIAFYKDGELLTGSVVEAKGPKACGQAFRLGRGQDCCVQLHLQHPIETLNCFKSSDGRPCLLVGTNRRVCIFANKENQNDQGNEEPNSTRKRG